MSQTVLQLRNQIDMSNKVGETRKEIEKLKSELETLIHTNLNKKSVISEQPTGTNLENVSSNIDVHKENADIKQNTAQSPPKNTNSPSTVRRNSSVNIDINTHREESKVKTKPYDRDSTREFIKRQKLRRKEKLKQEQMIKQELEELKKQKLEQLKNKTLQLINENVKKSNSKKLCAKSSEEKIIAKSNSHLVNKSNQNPLLNRNIRARSYDRDASRNNKLEIQGNTNKAFEKPLKRSRSVSREISGRKSSAKISKPIKAGTAKSKNSESNPAVELEVVVNEIDRFLKNDEKSDTEIHTGLQNSKQPNKISSEPDLPDKTTSKLSHNTVDSNINNVLKDIKIKPTNSLVIPQDKTLLPECDINIDYNQSGICTVKDVTDNCDLNNQQATKNIDNICVNTDSYIHNNDTVKEIESIKQKLEISISQSNSGRKKDDIPNWLLPPSSLPYPYNFISAVRKKLEIATKSYSNINLNDVKSNSCSTENSIKTAENNGNNVSVQCSIEEKREIKNIKSPKIIPPKSEELKTFMSHKCRKQLVYDSPPKLPSPKTITEIKKKSDKIKITDNMSIETSDSDTTKNIPDISEEERFFKPIKPDVCDNTKNITFGRPKSNTRNSLIIDQIKEDLKEKSKKTVSKSENSDRLKNISFNRPSDDASLDVCNLVKPDYKIDTSKISKQNSTSQSQSNRSKYPSDIESILFQYSKMKSLNKSNTQDDSHISHCSDLQSSTTDHLSLPKTMSSNNQKIEKNSSQCIKDDIESTKSNFQIKSEISTNKFEILASLARQHSSSLSHIPKQISESFSRNSNNETNQTTNANIDSLNQVTSGPNNSSKISFDNSKIKSLIKSSNNEESVNKNVSTNLENTISISFNSIQDNSNINSLDMNKYSEELIIKSKSDEILSKKLSVSNNKSYTDSYESQVRTDLSNKSFNEEGTSSLTHKKSNTLKTDLTLNLDECLQEKRTSKIDKTTQSRAETVKSSNIQNLSKPSINLSIDKDKLFRETKNNPNQIHLKFQAEVHLLNSFNNSLQQAVAVEKSLLDIQDPPACTVNFNRGCGLPEQIESLSVLEPSVCSQDMNISHITDSTVSEAVLSVTKAASDRSIISDSYGTHRQNTLTKNPYIGVSLGMFDQMIRDEDNRLQHLKAILKLRDKALFDRTKGELAWLEIQKKQLRENGQLNDVTVIKKKQRGLIIKLEQERHEMQRLKQAHKQAAKERKNALREHKNVIKQQLSSTDQIPTKIRRLSQLERRQSGPVKVYRVESRTEQVKETTMSRNNSGTDETISVKTTSSVVTHISGNVSVEEPDRSENTFALKPFPNSSITSKEKNKNSDKHSDKVKRALLMKEAELEKRRKEAEELLKWHERLKQKEAQVVELERQAKSIQLEDLEKKRVLTGAQLNKIWKNITGSVEKKFDDHKKYQMSKRSLDKFYQNARKIFKEISEERNNSKRESEGGYTSDFDSSHPSKINLSSSTVTRINETDANISPNKLLSERLRKISESSRLDFISASKEDTKISENITNSERTPSSIDEKIVTSNEQKQDNSINSFENKPTSKESVIFDSNIISSQELILSEESLNSESKTSSKDSEIIELQSTLEHKKISPSFLKESITSNKDLEINSSTDSDLPELEIIPDVVENEVKVEATDTNIEHSVTIDSNIISKYSEIKSVSSIDKTNKSNNSDFEIKSELMTPKVIDNILHSINDNKSSEISFVKSEFDQILETNAPTVSEESIPSTNKNESKLISEHENQNLSFPETRSKTSQISSEVIKLNESKIISEYYEKQNLSLPETQSKLSQISSEVIKLSEISENNSSHIPSVENSSKTNNYQIITTSFEIKSNLSEDNIKFDDLSNNKIENNIESENQILKLNTNISSEKNILMQSEKQDTLISPKTVSEENTSKNIDENILLQSESSESTEIESKTEYHASSDINAEQNKFINSEEESPIESHCKTSTDDVINEKYLENKPTLNLKSDLSKHESNTIKDESHELDLETSKQSVQSNIESNTNKKSSIASEIEKDLPEISNISDTKISLPVEEFESYEAKSNESLLSQSNKLQSKSISNDVFIKKTSLSEEKTELTKNDITQNTLDNKNIESEYESDFIIESTDDKIEEKESQEQNIQSQIFIYESDPSQIEFKDKQETDFVSEIQGKDSNSGIEIELYETDIHEKTEITENIGSIESSISVETENENSLANVEYKQVDNKSEIESATKSLQTSLKEDSKLETRSILDDNSEISSPLLESQTSTKLLKNSVSKEVEDISEDDKNTSEYLVEQQSDSNVSGVSHIDVRKRVSDILADSTPPRSDKSPRLQDLYITTYDVMTNSPESTPETGSPTNEHTKRDKSSCTIETPYRNEAEELLRKQLEIEQEIIRLERQQQQNIPYLFVREIPNKPPPPYKPPTAPMVSVINSVIPVHADQIKKFVDSFADILYQAYISGNLKEVSYKSNNEEKINSQRFVFDLCKEITFEVCRPIENVWKPSWKSEKNKFNSLISRKPMNKEGLCNVMNKKVLQLLNFEPVLRKDNLIIRWSRKKRDHVDEILVLESQTEETEWTNYDSEEQAIKDNLTSDIMDMLILETAQVMCENLKKKKRLSWINYC